MPFSDPWGPCTSVQPVRRSIVNHTTFAISAYCQVPLLHLSGVRQWFAGGSVQLLHVMTGIWTHDLARESSILSTQPRHPHFFQKKSTFTRKHPPPLKSRPGYGPGMWHLLKLDLKLELPIDCIYRESAGCWLWQWGTEGITRNQCTLWNGKIKKQGHCVFIFDSWKNTIQSDINHMENNK